MYAKSVEKFFVLLPIVAIVMAGELAILLAEEMFNISSGMMFVRTLLWSYLAYAAHAEFLLSADRDKSEDSKRVISFALRSFGLSLVGAIPVIFAIISFLPRGVNLNSFDGSMLGSMVLALLFSGIGLLAVFALFGTILPAFVADRDRGISAAFSRGLSQFFWTAGRLLIGPSVMMLVGLIVTGGIAVLFGGNGKLIDPNYFDSAITIISSLAMNVFFSLATIMTAWVLSAAFKRSYGLADRINLLK